MPFPPGYIVHFSATDSKAWMKNADPLPPTRCGELGTWTEKEHAVTCEACKALKPKPEPQP